MKYLEFFGELWLKLLAATIIMMFFIAPFVFCYVIYETVRDMLSCAGRRRMSDCVKCRTYLEPDMTQDNEDEGVII